MAIQLTNNATTTTAVALNALDTTVTVASGTGALFPVLGVSDFFYATLQTTGNTYEIVKVTARSGDVMTIVRAQENTAASNFPASSRFELRVTVENIRSLVTGDLDFLLL